MKLVYFFVLTCMSACLINNMQAQAIAAPTPDTPLEITSINCPDSFNIQTSETPLVSIVIPAYNHFDYTQKCLYQISRLPNTVPFEVIVIDDHSSDETAKRLLLIGGIRLISNQQNQGYLLSTNSGVFAARGEYIVLLNNDTMPQSGWIEAMVNTFKNKPNAGLVGAKLLSPDGKIQEAGCTVLANGFGYHRGNKKDRNDPNYNDIRTVDYCSAAAVMAPACLLKKLQGLDVRYAPAYYEDIDLAFRIHEAGFDILYQPKAEVVHFGSVTYDGDEKKIKYLKNNRKKFCKRWATILKKQPKKLESL